MTKGKVFLLGITLFFMIACGSRPHSGGILNTPETTTTGIVGGKEVTANELPAQVTVAIYDTLKKSICTGVLIGNNFVLTAAHCLGQDPRKLLVLFTRQTQTATQDMARAVVGAVGHSAWKPNLQQTTDHGDIAILKYYGTTPANYRAADILPKGSQLRTALPVLLVGYGANEGVRKSGSGQLRQTMTTIANVQFSASEILVEQRSGRGACQGDSGGPAFIVVNGVYYLWGISSRGAAGSANQCNTFGIYTNIWHYMPWIQTVVRSLTVTHQFMYAPQ